MRTKESATANRETAKWMVEFDWTYPCGREVVSLGKRKGFETKEDAEKWARENTTDGVVSEI